VATIAVTRWHDLTDASGGCWSRCCLRVGGRADRRGGASGSSLTASAGACVLVRRGGRPGVLRLRAGDLCARPATTQRP